MRKTHWELLQKTLLLSKIEEIKEWAAEENLEGKTLDEFQRAIAPSIVDHDVLGKSLDDAGSPLRALIFYAHFKGKIYYLAEAFAEELRKVKITVRASCIPESPEIICIELPAWTGYQAVYITAEFHPGVDSFGMVYCRLEMQFSRLTDIADRYDRTLLHFYGEDEVIEDALAQNKAHESISKEVINFAVNAYLYVHSGQPDLREYAPPPRPLSKKPKKERQYQRQCAEQSMLPVTLVGFNFKKESQVTAHFQGYWVGEGRRSFVLRWKESYTKGDPVLAI